MRSILSIIGGVLLVIGVVLVIRAGSDDKSPSAASGKDAQRGIAGAYECMPRDARRRFDRATKLYEARFGYVLDHAPAAAGDKPVDEVVEADARYVQLRDRVRAVLGDYLPGGSEFDRGCYRRAVARYDRVTRPE